MSYTIHYPELNLRYPIMSSPAPSVAIEVAEEDDSEDEE